MTRAMFAFATAAIAATVAAPAMATTRSSFFDVSGINGITVTPLAGLSYRVNLSDTPTFSQGGQLFPITDLFGFYALSNNADFSPLASLAPVGTFLNDSTNSGPGGIAGWRANPNRGIHPGESIVFTFDGLDQAHNNQWGFHVRVVGSFLGTAGNTGSITSVPAPTTGALAFVGGLVAWRRRRR
jgi:hypothetical protein